MAWAIINQSLRYITNNLILIAILNYRTVHYSDYCIQIFGHRMQKLTVNAGFGCPILKSGGCIFCNNSAFTPSYCQPSKSTTQQIDEGIRFHRQRRGHGHIGYLAYLQSYSNTYAPLQLLQERYQEALSHPKVEGLVIATRPDCVDEEKLDYIASLAREHYVMVEYGIESCYDRTLQHIHRGHNYECTVRTVEETARRGIPCGGHLILGLPSESREEMVAEANILSQLPLTTLKLHQLQILRGSQMGEDYLRDPTTVPPPFALDEYIALVCDFLERLRPDIIIERYAASVPPRYQVAPERGWKHPDGTPVKGSELADMIATELTRRNTYQGIYYTP